MPNVTVSIPHQLSRADAKKRVEGLIAQLQEQYGGNVAQLEQHWTGDTLAFSCAVMGFTISGNVTVEDRLVRLEIVLPMALAMFSGMIQKSIEEEGRQMLEHK